MDPLHFTISYPITLFRRIFANILLINPLIKVAFSPDSKELLTASADKTCKLWGVQSRKLIAVFPMGTQIEDQQVAQLLKNVAK